MGLDITAYRRLTAVPGTALDSDDASLFVLRPDTIVWVERQFPGRTAGLSPGVFAYEDSLGFRAGSYSGYNWWRDQLCWMAHKMSAETFWGGEIDGPFAELISFADNEGVIGPVVSKKLARDFAEYAEAAKQYAARLGYGQSFLQSYQNWRLAFDLAADAGCVSFH